jgi:hypothetical protein
VGIVLKMIEFVDVDFDIYAEQFAQDAGGDMKLLKENHEVLGMMPANLETEIQQKMKMQEMTMLLRTCPRRSTTEEWSQKIQRIGRANPKKYAVSVT